MGQLGEEATQDLGPSAGAGPGASPAHAGRALGGGVGSHGASVQCL